jgi:outer membrane usher protein FimD/PapC
MASRWTLKAGLKLSRYYNLTFVVGSAGKQIHALSLDALGGHREVGTHQGHAF